MTDIAQNSEGYNREAHIGLHFLIILFGISAWIGINGIFIQTAVLINISPEGWALPAYLVLVIQAANFGPLLYTILQYFRCQINESWWILCLLVSGTFTMGLLTFFYSEKTIIAGNEYSLTLFVLTFFNALVGCFSSVLFMPYLRNFNEKCLISYFIGEGLSGVLPSIIALIQGIGDNLKCTISQVYKNNTELEALSVLSGLRFTPNIYFLFIFIILFLSLTAFAILEYSSVMQNEKRAPKSISAVYNEKNTNVSHQVEKINHCSLEGNLFLHANSKHITKQTRNYLFILLAICCFFGNGFFPSIQSYSCLPYGNIAYQLSITFAQFANPVVCLLAFWLTVSKVKIISYLSVICLIIGSYVTYLALLSPSPPLQTTNLGVYLVITSWTLLMGLIAYLKLIIVSVFRNTVLPNILFNAGVIMQIGSASGAIFSFVIINFTNYFEMHDYCT
ncbi:unnamed protein product [Xylocopa violacea]|uniref:Riboflavin transporter n=1 Tax=Xylocopa violacea TaxID=135666 RepID=A0ABP1PBE5_XYLVO